MNGSCLRPLSCIRLGAFLSLVVLLSLSTVTEGQQGGAKWEVLNNKATGNFIVALAQDLQGNIWVGTEDKGVFRYDPKAAEGKQWTQFNSKNGLADDNAYAIACDKLGRVWVGTLNKGVSVYNGKDWKNYDVLDGPTGERIFAIATCPTDGDVWMATSAGLCRYSIMNDTWSCYTRAEGLPEDQANSITFDPDGTIFVGTQCHGIAMAKATDEYKRWNVATGPSQIPVTPSGNGLPTNLINSVLVSRTGNVFAATTAGLAWSKDKGRTWSYLRGRDYAAKVKGRWGGPPAGWKEVPKQGMDLLLPEDNVTCLAEDGSGLIWIGFRQSGLIAIDPKSTKQMHRATKKGDGLPDDFVTAVLPSKDFKPWAGSYGGGVGQASQPINPMNSKLGPGSSSNAVDVNPLPFPSSARPPRTSECRSLVQKIQELPKAKTSVFYLGEDWMSQGDWVGRYGRVRALLCAMAAPMNHEMGWGSSVSIQGTIGPNRTRDDVLRHWVHWIKTDNVRCLYDPVVGYRRQAEHDDHGEAYPQSHEGPDLWYTIEIPAGVFRVSLYFMNKDGHEGMNRVRDYLVEVKPYSGNLPQADQAVALATCRVRDFWGGVYKQFALAGPRTYYIKIAKNSSFNTICSAVLVDRLAGVSKPYEDGWLPFMENVRYERPKQFLGSESKERSVVAATGLWNALDDAYSIQSGLAMQRSNRVLAYRLALSSGGSSELLENWRWQLFSWTPDDRQKFRDTMMQAWGSRRKLEAASQLDNHLRVMPKK